MGPQCIIFQFKKRVQIECIVKIYGYTASREETIKKIIDTLELKESKIQIQKKRTEIPYEKPQTPLSKAYINLQLAYEHLFLDDQ